MNVLRRPLLTAALAALTGPSLVPAPAQSYPIDCAILLCLAGGWPSSAPCAAGWAEFIRRITPFPIEPPLQIWRCPMGVSMPVHAPSLRDRLIAIAADSRQGGVDALIDVQSPDQADIDLSNPAFDFVRSIHVYHIDYRQTEGSTPRRKTRSALGSSLGALSTMQPTKSICRADRALSRSGIGCRKPCPMTLNT